MYDAQYEICDAYALNDIFYPFSLAGQGDHILVSREASDETAFPRALWRVGVLAVVGRVLGWEALGKAVSAENEPWSVAEPNILS